MRAISIFVLASVLPILMVSLIGCLPLPLETERRLNVTTLLVASHMVDCQGVAPQKCLLVKYDPDDEWTYFYDQIEGFQYEEGYEYELAVLKKSIENPPADASATKWVLLRVISKTKMPVSLEGHTWILDAYIIGGGNLVGVLPYTEISATFDKDQISGSSGCNSYFGSYETDDDRLTIGGPIGSTKMFCPGKGVMEQEAQYLSSLEASASYRIEGKQLEISNVSGDVILLYTVASTEQMP